MRKRGKETGTVQDAEIRKCNSGGVTKKKCSQNRRGRTGDRESCRRQKGENKKGQCIGKKNTEGKTCKQGKARKENEQKKQMKLAVWKEKTRTVST